MVADMVAFVASQFTTSTWDVGAQELCSVVLIFLRKLFYGDICRNYNIWHDFAKCNISFEN